MRNKLGKVKQVHLEFCKIEDWLKSKNKTKDLYCQNCKKDHRDEKFIVLVTIEQKLNAHVCKNCGEYFIKNGAQDVLKTRKVNVDIKEKLINQAKRLGHRFAQPNAKFGRSSAEYTNKELKDLIKNRIDSERNDFHNFLKSPYKKTIEDFVKELNKEKYYTDVTPFDAFKNVPDIFYDWSSDENYDHRRWCSTFDATLKIGDKLYGYRWANANGDNSLEDAGFDINSVWETLYEKTITLTPSQRYEKALQLLESIKQDVSDWELIEKSLRLAAGL